jgi:hypothetical protein
VPPSPAGPRDGHPLATLRTVTDESELITFHDDEYDEDKPTRKPRKRWIFLGVLTAVAAMVLIMVSPTLLRVMAQSGATLTMPEKVGQLTRVDTPSAQTSANNLVTTLRATIDLERSEGAVYADDKDQIIMLFGGTGLLWNPERELDAVLEIMLDNDEEATRGLATVDAGPLGGVMKCAPTDDQVVVTAICGWADHGSIALTVFQGRSPDEAATLTRDLRAASLQR